MNSKQAWEKESDCYAERNKDKQRSDFVLTKILQSKIKFDSVLQIGCSTGDILNQITQRFKVPGTGIEPGKHAVELAKEKYPHLNFIQAFAQDLPFEDNRFDLCIVHSVLSWIPRERIYHAVGEILRVTKKAIYINEFNPDKPYKNKWCHVDGINTYKMNPEKLFESMGMVETIYRTQDYLDLGDWGKRVTTIYRIKEESEIYPLRNSEEFGEAVENERRYR